MNSRAINRKKIKTTFMMNMHKMIEMCISKGLVVFKVDGKA